MGIDQIAPAADVDLVAALRRGEDAAFRGLVERYHAQLVRLARAFVPSQAVAEEVAQEAWVGVLKGLDRFEGRSSLKTWIFRILVNIAKTRGEREGRSVPFSAIETGPSVEPDRFLPASDPDWPYHWDDLPNRFPELPEQQAVADEIRRVVDAAIDVLPENQRAVITLRDIQGWDSDEVCNALGIQQTNQRVLLHRARTKVRAALERYFDQERAS